MYIPQSPLPSLDIVWKALRAFKNRSPGLPWKGPGEIKFFPRGAYALAAAAKAVTPGKKRPVCFLPAYFCNQSLVPLRQSGAEIVFYRIMQDFSPDWDDAYVLALKKKPDLFILVHYFGLINDVSGAIAFTKGAGCVLLEDGAHVLQPCQGMSPNKTIHLFSPHKLLPLPPIGLLSLPKALTYRWPRIYPIRWGRDEILWLIKRVIQMGIVTLCKIKWKRLMQVDANVPPGLEIASSNVASLERISHLAIWGLRVLHAELNRAGFLRRSNYNYIAEMISASSKVKEFLLWPEWPEGQVPYLFPIRIAREFLHHILKELREKAIPAHTWPDLPPEVLHDPQRYSTTLSLKNTLIFLPIHQALKKKHLDYIGENLLIAFERSI